MTIDEIGTPTPPKSRGKTQGIRPDKALERLDDKVMADILAKPKERLASLPSPQHWMVSHLMLAYQAQWGIHDPGTEHCHQFFHFKVLPWEYH